MEMVLNELSLYSVDFRGLPATNDIPTARRLMSLLLQTIKTAKQQGIVALRTHSDISNASIAPNYLLSQWRNDKAVDHDEKNYFRSLQTKYPLLNDISSDVQEKFHLSEFKCNNELAETLGFASLTEALAISLNSAPCWDTSDLELEASLIENEGDNIISELITISHASCPEHVLHHQEWIKKLLRPTVSSGKDLWENKTELFPHLIFCDRVESQVQQLGSSDLVKSFERRLDELNRYCENWTTGGFDFSNIPGKVAPQSQMTLNLYKQEHTFRCPDGNNRIFSWHIRVTQGQRIHFFPQEDARHIIIGHAGKHLPTASG